jgi:small subunit ribosomal protein S6
MRNYEVVYIADPELSEETIAELQAKVVGWIEAAGGKALKIDAWGKRRLAYPIRKRHDGHYIFIQTELPPRSTIALERDLRLNEGILRFMITLAEAPQA